MRDWCNALQGAGETMGGSNLGAMVGGRGCVEALGGDQYLVTVAWQGMGPVSAPPAGVTCGQDLYDGGTELRGRRLSPRRDERRPHLDADVIAMVPTTPRQSTGRTASGLQRGFSLIELMVSLVIGLVILGALVGIFVNTSGGNREMARANTPDRERPARDRGARERCRACRVLGRVRAGVRRPDDRLPRPDDVPTAIPDPCQDYTADPGPRRTATTWSTSRCRSTTPAPRVCAGVIVGPAGQYRRARRASRRALRRGLRRQLRGRRRRQPVFPVDPLHRPKVRRPVCSIRTRQHASR